MRSPCSQRSEPCAAGPGRTATRSLMGPGERGPSGRAPASGPQSGQRKLLRGATSRLCGAARLSSPDYF